MKKYLLLVLLFVLLLSACNFSLGPVPEPTATATLTATPAPPTATPTRTPPPTPTERPPEIVVVEEGNYSFEKADGMEVEIDGASMFSVDRTGDVIITFSATPHDEGESMLDIIDIFLGAIAGSAEGEFIQGDPFEILVDGVSGRAVDLTGSLYGAPIAGLALAVSPSPGYAFFGMAVAKISSDPDLWDEYGAGLFADVLQTVNFIVASSACAVSTDDTYGYTPENPVKVGGGAFDGPGRERAYLDNLLGPNGEALSYERRGSIPHGDTILDIYVVSGLGQAVELHLDEYSYAPLLAPVGFTCKGEFPLGAP